jgi:DNA-binding NarL/FixJ family response regulator
MVPHTTQVLLIEDNPGDADLVRLRLVEGDSPVSVNCVGRLSEGLASLTSETPSVVLLDLNLPDSHGAETFRRVRDHSPNVPIVVLSGQDDQALAERAVNNGVQDYLVKGDISSKHVARPVRSLEDCVEECESVARHASRFAGSHSRGDRENARRAAVCRHGGSNPSNHRDDAAGVGCQGN